MSISPMTVVLLANDLMMISTVSGYAATAGAEFRSFAGENEAAEFIVQNPNVLLLVDLGIAGLNVTVLANAIPAAVLANAVAYGPHVHTAKLEAAVDAGFGSVMSRGQFSTQSGRLVAAAMDR